MMKWRKSPESLVRAFDAALPDEPAVERKLMFGYPAGFVNGNMFCGLHQENVVLRLDDEGRATLLEHDGAAIFEPMPGRPMREYVVAPPDVVGSKKELGAWMKHALTYVATLPAKKARPAARPKRTSTAKRTAKKR
jgi:hypothetical protein